MPTVDPEEAARQLDAQTKNEEATASGDTEEVPPVTTIELDVKDGRGKRYQGRFYYRVPNIGDQIRIGQLKATMLPQGTPDAVAAVLVDTLTYLQVCIQFNDKHPKPTWWKPTALYDATPFSALYRRCLDYEAKFHGGNPVDQPDDGEAGEAGGSDRGGAAPLERKVRPPSQRRETLAGDGS